MDNTEQFIEYVKKSKSIVFFGGAGVSTESGIPDFRSKDGLYNQQDVQFDQYDPEYLLSNDCLYQHAKVFFEFYRQKMDARKFKPNITHEVLAKMEEKGILSAIVTQNIDGLHQKAGSKRVYEIHGTTRENYCTGCGNEVNENYIFESKEAIPRCKKCGAMIRPRVVLYGEQLPDETVNKAIRAISEADMLIIGGTSLKVYPAAGFVHYFQGKHLAVINKEKISFQIHENEDVVINDSLGKIFARLGKEI